MPITSTPKVMHMLSNINNMITQQGIEFNTHFFIATHIYRKKSPPKNLIQIP
jgi:hypothetical protein